MIKPIRLPWRRRRPPSARQLGDDARGARAWPDAEAHYVRHLEAEPSDQPIWVQLGHARKEQGKLRDAEDAYARAARIAPEDPDAREHLDALRKRRGDEIRRRPRLAALGWLRAGERLLPGQALSSRDGGHRLVLTADGELRLERLQAAATELVWSSGSDGLPSRLEIGGRGGPVLVDVSGEALWSAEPAGPPGAALHLTDAGALDLVDGRTAMRLAPALTSTPASAVASPSFGVDAPGALSLVVQGPLFRSNVEDTAQRLAHWRALFPAAQIVYAVSSTDLLRRARPGLQPALAPTRPHADDGPCRAALAAIERSCDAVVLAEAALPLPPFKDDSGPNNFNLQLAAARAGLDQARGRWCLRIRSDAVFATRDFLGDYAVDAARPRGATARFTERILIAPVFTLNPYTVERMPLHFSDWFHFGRLEDVRRLWDVAPMSLADAIHYRTHSHHACSNARERQFLSRWAVEQHLVYGCFRSLVPGLELRFHNDLACVGPAMQVWVDNFAMCDLRRSHFAFEKYVLDQTDPSYGLQCLTRDDWLRLVGAPGVDAAEVLADKIGAAAAFADEFGLSP